MDVIYRRDTSCHITRRRRTCILEVHRQAVGQVGDPVTFDASAEIGETPIHFMAEGQVGQVTTEHTYAFNGLAVSGVGSVSFNVGGATLTGLASLLV